MTTRDTTSSSSSSSSIPSPRTVTRYTVYFHQDAPQREVYLCSEIDPWLSALAEAEQENARVTRTMDTNSALINQLYARAEAAEAAGADNTQLRAHQEGKG